MRLGLGGGGPWIIAKRRSVAMDGCRRRDPREGFDTDRDALFFAQNRRNPSQRLELMKYNPYMKKHTLHRELKK